MMRCGELGVGSTSVIHHGEFSHVGEVVPLENRENCLTVADGGGEDEHLAKTYYVFFTTVSPINPHQPPLTVGNLVFK